MPSRACVEADCGGGYGMSMCFPVWDSGTHQPHPRSSSLLYLQLRKFLLKAPSSTPAPTLAGQPPDHQTGQRPSGESGWGR